MVWSLVCYGILELCGGSNFVEGETLKNALLPPACGKLYCRLVSSQVSTFEINRSGEIVQVKVPNGIVQRQMASFLFHSGTRRRPTGDGRTASPLCLLKIQNLALLSDNNHDLTSADHTTRRLT